MPRVARRHHFLPQGYLAGFTDSGSKDGRLTVLDLKTRVGFRTTPLNVAVEKDFKRVDIEGRQPDAVETALAPIEGRAAEAIRRVLATTQFPSNADFNLILNLLSLVIAQNPKSRRVLHSSLAKFDNVSTMIAEFEAQDELLDALAKRKWSVLVAPDEGPHFITSDYPFSLTMEHGFRGTPGFLVPNTELYFPLAKTLGFIGVLGRPLNAMVTANTHVVAVMNRRMLRQAAKQVFLPGRSFVVFEHETVVEQHVQLRDEA